MPPSRSNYVFGKRSRSGCWTCRRRHQKCDETKPTCWNCRVRGVECGGYGITLTEFTVCSGRNGQMVSKMRRDGPDEADPEENTTKHRKLGSNSQLQIDIAKWNTMTTAGDVFPPSGLQISTPGSASLAECNTPLESSLTDSTADDSEDLFPATNIDDIEAWSCESHLALDFNQDVESPAVLFIMEQSPRPPPSDAFEQHLFNHYMNNLVLRLYPVKLDQNPYRVVYGAFAAESTPLLKAIHFASALHLSKLGQLPQFAIKHYRTAMRDSFRNALTDTDKAWSLGATVLLTVVFDVIGTGLDAWSSKLIGCRRLLEMGLSKSTGQVRANLQCVLLQYNWVVTMGRTLVKGLLPSATFDELKCIDRASALDRVIEDMHMANHQSHWWDNLPDFRMHLFLREATEYSITVDRLRSSPESMGELLELMPAVAELINKIQNWQPDISAVDPEFMDSVQHFNEIWRLGMLCYAYSDIYGLDSSHSYIQACIEASLDHFRKLSWFQACLFPVFMIAVHCKTEEARGCYEAGLQKMHTSLAFQGPLSVALTLKKIWEHLDRSRTGKASWRDIVQSLGMELNILL